MISVKARLSPFLKTISTDDSPSILSPMTYEQADRPADGKGLHFLTEMCSKYTFNTYIMAQTKDTRGGADNVFTTLAYANWVFNDFGDVAIPSPYRPEMVTWKGTDASVALTTGKHWILLQGGRPDYINPVSGNVHMTKAYFLPYTPPPGEQ